MTLSPGVIIGTIVAGLILQAVVAFVASLITAARTQTQIEGVKNDVAEIKRKLGNGGEGVFLRTDLAREIIAGLSNKDTTAAATIQALQNDVANLKAAAVRRGMPDHHT